jgi:hypothetical protein
MGIIPEGAKSYLANIVEELTVKDDSRNVVHANNLILIRADSPEEAYRKARELGTRGSNPTKTSTEGSYHFDPEDCASRRSYMTSWSN